MGGYSNWGLRWTLECAQRTTQSGLPVYVRTASPAVSGASSEQFAQFGFQISASGQDVVDMLIDPPPVVTEVSLRDIGLNSAMISFGARRFVINHSWVRAIQEQKGYYDPNTGLPDWYRVFRDPTVVGLFYNDRLFNIVSLTHKDIAGLPWQWNLICNAAEQPATS